MRNKREDKTNTTDIQRVKKIYCEQLYDSKLDKLEEMDRFLETYNLSRLNQKETENLDRPITAYKI